MCSSGGSTKLVCFICPEAVAQIKSSNVKEDITQSTEVLAKLILTPCAHFSQDFNYIHRTYITLIKAFHMKKIKSPACSLCDENKIGTFMHMYWDCKKVKLFWEMISSMLSASLEITIPCLPSVLLLNDTSDLNLNRSQTALALTGITAAKKLLAQRWKSPDILSKRQWIVNYLDILNMELSVARMHGSKMTTISAWQDLIRRVQTWL